LNYQVSGATNTHSSTVGSYPQLRSVSVPTLGSRSVGWPILYGRCTPFFRFYYSTHVSLLATSQAYKGFLGRFQYRPLGGRGSFTSSLAGSSSHLECPDSPCNLQERRQGRAGILRCWGGGYGCIRICVVGFSLVSRILPLFHVGNVHLHGSRLSLRLASLVHNAPEFPPKAPSYFVSIIHFPFLFILQWSKSTTTCTCSQFRCSWIIYSVWSSIQWKGQVCRGSIQSITTDVTRPVRQLALLTQDSNAPASR
jgi:hypothetical protein